MKGTLFLIVCGLSVVTAFIDKEQPYCFQYRWVGPVFSNIDRFNCTAFKGVPCVEPLFNATAVPDDYDHLDIWQSENSEKLCILKAGDVCVSYTFRYNDAVANTSRYCGRVIEDKTIAITSGCYTQHVDGYDVQVCACSSGIGMLPCNSSATPKLCLITLILPAISVVILRRTRFKHIT